jgi:uncharacterized protein YceH (UPF0502 family)
MKKSGIWHAQRKANRASALRFQEEVVAALWDLLAENAQTPDRYKTRRDSDSVFASSKAIKNALTKIMLAGRGCKPISIT